MRRIIATNEQEPTGPVEPRKLNQITTASIPNAAKLPDPKPIDLTKMITTNNVDSIVRRQKEATVTAEKAAAEEMKHKPGVGRGDSR